MSSSRDYEAAVTKLNTLQTNASILEAIRKSGNTLNLKSIPEIRAFVQRIGYKVTDLDKLNIIHIAGTKGKGSTAAFCESIVRRFRTADEQSRPLKTGLFTSPHLLEVRERLRIDGAPLQKELFAKYFFEVWDRLEATKPSTIDEDHPDKPTYFRFLTLMAFHTFLSQNVDVVVLEVGLGGEYDSTNVVENPVVCGITSLGIDHVAILGNTLTQIAWHKGGIMKRGIPTFVAPQDEEAMVSLRKRVADIRPSKFIELNDSDIAKLNGHEIGLAGAHQQMNAAVAVSLCREWAVRRKDAGVAIAAPESAIDEGLRKTRWPGRGQIYVTKEYPSVTWFLDGAHTPESMVVCSAWYKDQMQKRRQLGGRRVLMFNCTNSRDGLVLLKSLVTLHNSDLPFAHIIFCSNDLYSKTTKVQNTDTMNYTVHKDPELKVQKELSAQWDQLSGRKAEEGLVSVLPSISDAVELLGRMEGNLDVLVTGSLYLVGGTLNVLHAEVS
ncbi:Folylpolyglutamate synthetase [Rhizophlyctis rosea]|uniref:Folylpolyglutamate synthase n=1 Tax=Rhizophlyctis rosea TaxID=64517 RepID=A0AAD5X8Y9_9FUNG|nr:Folylpolyglutamate synthetase [Rhizophlyctis rosea]